MALPPRFRASRWGCAVCGAYPDTSLVFFHQDEAQAEESRRDAERKRARRNTPGWTGPGRDDVIHGVWLCDVHGEAAEPYRSMGRRAGLAALKAAVGETG